MGQKPSTSVEESSRVRQALGSIDKLREDVNTANQMAKLCPEPKSCELHFDLIYLPLPPKCGIKLKIPEMVSIHDFRVVVTKLRRTSEAMNNTQRESEDTERSQSTCNSTAEAESDKPAIEQETKSISQQTHERIERKKRGTKDDYFLISCIQAFASVGRAGTKGNTSARQGSMQASEGNVVAGRKRSKTRHQYAPYLRHSQEVLDRRIGLPRIMNPRQFYYVHCLLSDITECVNYTRRASVTYAPSTSQSGFHRQAMEERIRKYSVERMNNVKVAAGSSDSAERDNGIEKDEESQQSGGQIGEHSLVSSSDHFFANYTEEIIGDCEKTEALHLYGSLQSKGDDENEECEEGVRKNRPRFFPPIVQDNECSICMDALNEVVLPCSHSFCSKCYSAWTKESNNCPLCRKVVELSKDSVWELKFDELRDMFLTSRSLAALIFEYLDRVPIAKRCEASAAQACADMTGLERDSDSDESLKRRTEVETNESGHMYEYWPQTPEEIQADEEYARALQREEEKSLENCIESVDSD